MFCDSTEDTIDEFSTLVITIAFCQFDRLIDRDILRLAVTEIVYLGLEERIAINEAIELAKRYSDDQGRKLINGVLRRVTEQLKAEV